jgi:cob(I)alamin adenosyltransferase
MKTSRGTGDRGKTGLFSGERVSKAHLRVEACGDLDELSSFLGALATGAPKGQSDLVAEIKGIQSALLTAGALMGTSETSPSGRALERITGGDIAALEAATDRIDGGLPELKGFLIPGGHESACWAHMARTVCRRAERSVVGVIEDLEGDGSAGGDPSGRGRSSPGGGIAEVLVYLNRLSDYLFCVARHCNMVTGTEEEIWEK